MTLRWIEQLDADGDVVRVLVDDETSRYVARVVCHRDRSWRVERREKQPWGLSWVSLRGAPRGRYKVRPVRFWRSPEAAMRVATECMSADGEKK